MREIKIVISKGGKAKITTPNSNEAEVNKFTEKLAEEMGKTEERHKSENYEFGHDSQEIQQKA
jgi:hypothetical protein